MSGIEMVPVIHHPEHQADLSPYNGEAAEKVRAFHRSMTEYAPTPLVSLAALAKRFGVKSFRVKDESKRFGLNAFKALGGSYAMDCVAAGKTWQLTFITATDGNHGRGVAWAASRLGHKAVVLMPRGTAQERLDNILKLGADARITDLMYDDVVRLAARLARENGWYLIQDTSWEGYETVPQLIMQGYLTMFDEMAEQLGDEVPTHLFLQAGVGSMAAAGAAYFAMRYGEKRQKVIIVEPNTADCIFRTAKADDGKTHFCGDDMHSIMAGLCCGEPCMLAWDILRDTADYAVTCPDYIAANGMRMLGNPLPGDERIISGESGASTSGLAAALLTDARLQSIRDELGLDEKAVVLCISTEGDTDRENYRKIVWQGAWPEPSAE